MFPSWDLSYMFTRITHKMHTHTPPMLQLLWFTTLPNRTIKKINYMLKSWKTTVSGFFKGKRITHIDLCTFTCFQHLLKHFIVNSPCFCIHFLHMHIGKYIQYTHKRASLESWIHFLPLKYSRPRFGWSKPSGRFHHITPAFCPVRMRPNSRWRWLNSTIDFGQSHWRATGTTATYIHTHTHTQGHSARSRCTAIRDRFNMYLPHLME